MTYDLQWSDRSREQFGELQAAARGAKAGRLSEGRKKSTKAEGLFKQVAKAICHLKSDSKHPGLHSHEFDSMDHPYKKGEKVWESYVQNKTPGAYRLFWCYGKEPGQLTILAIIPHP